MGERRVFDICLMIFVKVSNDKLGLLYLRRCYPQHQISINLLQSDAEVMH